MIQLFDKYGLYETPTFVLCNPDLEELYSLGEIYDRKLEIRANALSTFSFTAPSKVNGNDIEYYDYLSYRRVIYIENIGYFSIVSIEESNDGIISEKKIKAFSYDVEINNKKLTLFKGTYKFYDYITPSTTLIGTILSYLPGWTVGTVSGALLQKYRTFDVSDTTIYNFLMNEVEQAYQCVFSFNTTTKTVSAYSTDDFTTSSDIFLSYNNLVEDIGIKEVTEEMVTALAVYGGGDLSINTVNPLGNDIIYNFDYYKSTDWMSQGLINAIDAWDVLIDANQQDYADLLTILKNQNDTLVNQKAQLVDLKGELAALDGVRKARIQQGLDITAITAQVNAKKSLITSKKSNITATKLNIANTTLQLQAINTLLSFDSNFTALQQVELDPFILGGTYQNQNFIQTDIMTNSEIQDQAQELYDQAKDVLTKLALPRYTFELNAINFIFLQEYDEFTNNLQLGSIVTVEIRDGVYAYPVLLGFDLNYDDPGDFSLIFSNRLRLDDSSYIFTDLFDQMKTAAVSSGFNSIQWGSWENNYKDDVSLFIESALDAALNNVVSSSNQDIIIDENGLKGRSYISEDIYDPRQIWLMNNMIAFTQDDWNTASLALGQISTSSGSAYGIVADVIVGRIIAGNQLTITNENNTFIVDGSGATITNGTISVIANQNKNRILLDPYNGFRIQKTVSGSWVDRFYADLAGNVNFTGKLTGATGDFTGTITANAGFIGGFTINADGLYKDSSHYLKSTGDLKWGKLSIIGSTAIFNGNFYANNLLGLLQHTQIGSVNADTISVGTLSAIDIFGCNIYWPGVWMGSSGTGVSTISADESLVLESGGASAVTIYPDHINLYNDNEIAIGNGISSGRISLYSSIYTRDAFDNNGWGVSEQFVVNTTSGNKQLSFINGILCTGDPPTVGGGVYLSNFGWSFVIPMVETGIVGFIEIPYDCNIETVRVVSDVVGSASIALYVRNYSQWGEAYDTLISGSGIIITSSNKYSNFTLSGWTTGLFASDYLVIKVVSYSTFEQVTLSIKGRK